MLRALGPIVLVAGLLTSCASSGGSPAAGHSTGPGSSGSGVTSSASSPTTTAPLPTSSLSGSADITCLVHGGEPWQVNTSAMESQLRSLLGAKFEVDGVSIAGNETLTVTPGLHATWTDETIATIRARLPNPPTPLVMKQTHHGTALGSWRVDGNQLLPEGSWTGGLRTNTTMTIGGRTGSAPVTGGVEDLGATALRFSCAADVLHLTVPGKSPFAYVFD